jgi:hypothetical protein
MMIGDVRTLVLDGRRSRHEAIDRAMAWLEDFYSDQRRQFMSDPLTADAEGELYAIEDLDEVLEFYREHQARLEANARATLRRLVCDRCDAAGVK